MTLEAESPEPTRQQVGETSGPLLLEFGTEWCGYCKALAPRLAEILEGFPAVRHLKIEDGPGLPLGRSFGVKLWPTLVFLRDGKVLGQVSRPGPADIRRGLEAITRADADDQSPSP